MFFKNDLPNFVKGFAMRMRMTKHFASGHKRRFTILVSLEQVTRCDAGQDPRIIYYYYYLFKTIFYCVFSLRVVSPRSPYPGPSRRLSASSTEGTIVNKLSSASSVISVDRFIDDELNEMLNSMVRRTTNCPVPAPRTSRSLLTTTNLFVDSWSSTGSPVAREILPQP